MNMSNQRGSFLLYGIIALVVVSAVGIGFYSYNSALVRAERAERDRDIAQQANGELMSDNINLRTTSQRKDELLAARQTKRNTEDEVDRRVRAKLDELFRNSKEARDWRDSAVPPDVLRSLRSESSGAVTKDGKGAAPSKPPIAKPGN